VGSKEKIEFSVKLVRETEKAWLIDDGTQELWVPKSQTEWIDEDTIAMPEWLAKDKELI